ncbi:MAG TPA: D-alanyl-D-alanine carboxypeptidase [Clostridiales bacterium]|nr:D-alanyl-D-alanine carboxypeptidase [Clostridiales bacterium]
MKIKLLVFLLFACFSFGGCQKNSDELLAYNNENVLSNSVINNEITETDFFAKNLAIITEEDNQGGDPDITSEASLLVNITNNEIIYGDNVYEKLYPASLTKLMTALIVLRYGELTDTVTISYNASHITESGAKLCGFNEGDIVSMDVLLNSLLIYSGNDAGIAIAEHIAGSEENFSKMMNEEAIKIGAVDTNFTNSHGLHNDNHYSTAYDLYLIFNQLVQYDTFLSIIDNPTYTAVYKDKDNKDITKTFASTNLYLDERSNSLKEGLETLNIIGGKTGTTSKAGNCLILLTKDNNQNSYISLILKGDNRTELYSQMSHMLSMLTVNQID